MSGGCSPATSSAWALPGAVCARAWARWMRRRSITRGSRKSPGTIRIAARRPSEERLDAGLRPPQDQRVDVVRALVGVDRLEVRQDAHHVEFVGDAVAAVHIACRAGDV